MFFSNAFKKHRKPKPFGYTPLYYDEKKEDLERREMQIAKELGVLDISDATVKRQLLKDKMRKEYSRNRKAVKKDFRQSAINSSNIRMIVVLGIIGTLTYLVFTNLDKFVKVFNVLTK